MMGDYSHTTVVLIRQQIDMLQRDVLRAVPDETGTALAEEIAALGRRVIARMRERRDGPMRVQGASGLPMCDSL